MTAQIEALYKRHYDRLLLTARNLLDNDEEARDAVSDVFAELLTSGRELRPDQAESFLLVSVRNRCLNMLDHRRVVKVSEQQMPLDTEATTYDEPPLEQVLDYMDTELTEKTSRVLKQRFLGHKRYNEIAQDMGISRVAVFKHLSKGIHQLQVHFAWYHAVVVLLLLSGLAYALISHFASRQEAPAEAPPAPTMVSPATDAQQPAVVHYEDAPLREILTDIADYHHAGLQFESKATGELRLYYDWHQQDALTSIVRVLNTFENIAIDYRQNTLYVR